jgi:hypothetical protein
MAGQRSDSQPFVRAEVDVDARTIWLGSRCYSLVATENAWNAVDPTSGQRLWFRPVPKVDGGWWYVGEPHDARVLCSLWCGECERAGVDPRPPSRGKVSGTFRRS